VATKKRKRKTTKKAKPLLGPEQVQEIGAWALLAVAALVALSLIPLERLGGAGAAFPSGNAVGALGHWIRRWLVQGLGVSAVLVPMLTALLGAFAAGWIERAGALRLGLLFVGLGVLVPLGIGITGAVLPAGVFGMALAQPLSAALGWLGATLLTGAGLVVLSIATIRWNPVTPIGRAVVQGGGALGRTALKARESMRIAPTLAERRNARAAAARAADEDEDEPWPEPEAEALQPAAPNGRAKKPKKKRGGKRAESAPRVADLPDPLRADHANALPTLDLLTAPAVDDRQGMEEELELLGEVLVEKLRTFSVECTLGGRTTGPVVTQFEVVPAAGVKVNKIANLDADLALAMRAKSIRIVAPIPGKGAVGVEIPNPAPQMVQLREIVESRAFLHSRGVLPLALGQDLTGRPYVSDLAKMPHVLIAGATGAGKSVCLNTIITSLVYRHTPETLRLLLIDPKMVELSTYSDLPHLRHSVVTDPKDAAGVLKWAVLEMERRYALLSANGVRSLAEFNKRVLKEVPVRRPDPQGPEGDPDRFLYREGILPFIVVVVDELADLMMTVQGEVERPLTQLAQKARAIGIHLIVATQRPSVNVITGLIKANFPTRIAFRVASKTDSRTILDQNGADALLGNGDMLFLPPGQSEPVRIQGAYIDTEDTDRLMRWFREQAGDEVEVAEAAPTSEDDILDVVRQHEADQSPELGVGEGGVDRDDLFKQAAEVCIQHEQGSTSLLQRKLRVGYGRAARIVDQLHEAGILGPPDGSKPREVLIGLAGLDLLLSGHSSGTGAETTG